MNETKSTVAIGIPVYNEARYLRSTLASIGGQADQIIICDNASTDGTEEICREFQEKRPGAKYARFKKNRGAAASFRHCLELADTEYFMWVGGHDLIPGNYVQELQMVLDNEQSLVQAYANALHLDDKYRYAHFYYYKWSEYLLSDSVEERVAATVRFLSNCTIFHGLYRKKVLDSYFSDFNPSVSIGGFYMDHVILSYVAMQGKMALCPYCNYIRLDPRAPESLRESWFRVVKASNPELPEDPNIVPMTLIRGQKKILDMLKNRPGANMKIIEEANSIMLKRWGKFV